MDDLRRQARALVPLLRWPMLCGALGMAVAALTSALQDNEPKSYSAVVTSVVFLAIALVYNDLTKIIKREDK